MSGARELDGLFQRAMAAVDAADLAGLTELLARHPRVASERLGSPGAWLRDQIGPALDSFFKQPYLLWLITEDAPRTRKLPENIAALARTIIKTAKASRARDLRHLLDTTLHFAICSPIGRDDGRQLELLDVLIEEGAGLDNSPSQALICGNRAAALHLLARGAPLDLQTAVCIDRWEDVTRFGPGASKRDKQFALALAALNGRAEGLRRLIPFGVQLDEFSTGFYSHATPLHHAVWSGSLEAVRVLVEAGARLDPVDKAHGGTPLGWAEYALSGGVPPDAAKEYGEIARYLRERGAPG